MNAILTRIALPALVLAAGLSSASAQTTVSIVADRDNTLYEDLGGATSNGLGFLFSGLTGGGSIRRALLHFDVASNVPAGAVILAADLELFVAQSVVAAPLNCDAHRVLQTWGEGSSLAPGNGGAGTAAAAGDVTWTKTFFGQPGADWTNIGGDFAATPSFSFPLPPLFAVQTGPLPGVIADAQLWLDQPSQNFGWLLKLDEVLFSTAHRINSRESASNKPTLTITYLLPSGTGTIGTGCPVGSGTFAASFAAPAIGGTIVPILYSNAPASSVGINFYSLGIDPVGFTLFANCKLYLPLTQPLYPADAFLTDASGNGASTFAVPTGFPGFLVSLQAAVIDNTPLSVTPSNAAVMILQ